MRAGRLLTTLALILAGVTAWGQTPAKSDNVKILQDTKARYPAQWEVPIPPGTALAQLRDTYEARKVVSLAPSDLEDHSPLPFWFRAYLRDTMPGLPDSGPYQYPRAAKQMLEWMMTHPDLKAVEAAPTKHMILGTITTVGANLNISNVDAIHSEPFVARDYGDTKYLVAAANQITGSGHLQEFYSADSGKTWSRTELPLAAGNTSQCDPGVAFATDGTVWSSTLGITSTPYSSSISTEVFRSTDHGATWNYVATVSNGTHNDKEMIAIDTYPTSPHRNNIYVAWDVAESGSNKGVWLSRSTDNGTTWSAPLHIGTDYAVGVHLATGPGGELYVAWPDLYNKRLSIRESADGGLTFGTQHQIATTNASFDIGIPAMCVRRALIYLSLGVDRSNSSRQGTVYAAWTDINGTPEPGCSTAGTTNSNVYVSSSKDHGTTWSAPTPVHTDVANSDQFNQWVDVDPSNGVLHAMFYDTRQDTTRHSTDVYYSFSTDGGVTWRNETRVTTATTDETATGTDPFGNQYGDYNGLVAFHNESFPVWTDRRAGNPGNHEQVYTAQVTDKTLIVMDVCKQWPTICPMIDLCHRHPEVCHVQIDPHELLCKVRPCVVVGPLPPLPCLTCPPGPFINVTLDGVRDGWTVQLIRRDGRPAPHRVINTKASTVISFKPEADLADYLVVYTLKKGGKIGSQYSVKALVEAADREYEKPAAAAIRH